MDNSLISRQAAIDAVNNAFDRETLLTGFVRSIAVRAIRDMPSAQPEMIGCKGCKHLQPHNICKNDRCARMYKDRYEAERRTDVRDIGNKKCNCQEAAQM